MTVPNVLLSGIVGSTAYGLARPGSDVDRLGIFAAPTEELHGLRRPVESHVTNYPDRTLHEAAKWCRLALSGNPTVMELVWLPDDLYEVRTQLGDDLIRLRAAFLSAKRVRDAYLGYATQQFRRLESRGDGSFSADTRKRTAKHARHLKRLCHQGLELYTTGRLTVRVEDPDTYHEFGEQVAADAAAARPLLAEYEAAFDANRSVLPDRPDEAAVEAWLRQVRADVYKAPAVPVAQVPPTDQTARDRIARAALARVRSLHRESCLLARGDVRRPAFTCGICDALDTPGATPTAVNPPGSTVEQLPDHVLAQLPTHPYLSTACQTADAVAVCAVRGLPQYDELRAHAERLHARCRLNHKFTGRPCTCGCHPEPAPYPAATQAADTTKEQR